MYKSPQTQYRISKREYKGISTTQVHKHGFFFFKTSKRNCCRGALELSGNRTGGQTGVETGRADRL